jgi:hypothetical protein
VVPWFDTSSARVPLRMELWALHQTLARDGLAVTELGVASTAPAVSGAGVVNPLSAAPR